MPKVLIIADDLTGAADCGVVFAECGMEAMVLLGRRDEDAATPGGWSRADVLAIDAGTRCLVPETAAETVARLVVGYDSLAAHSIRLFKKVDSTLRGNLAAELAAALKARRASTSARVAILFAPAFPAHGRTTVNGRQRVHGHPLEETEFRPGANDGPRGKIAAMLGEAELSCELVELALVRSGADALKNALLRIANEADVLICDAETDGDLEAIANAGMALGERTVWAGSAGLARYVPHAAGFARDFGLHRLPISKVNGPILFVVGSPAAASREQARALSAAPGVACFRVAEQQPAAAAIARHLARGEDVLLQLDPSSVKDDQLLIHWLADAIQSFAKYMGALFATGGETARAILDAWGIDRLRLVGEVEPGLPYSMTQDGILVLTKAGGFGMRDTMLRCRDFVHRLGYDSGTLDVPAAVDIKRAEMQKPIIAITMGDAAGVGPEIIVKSLAHRDVYERCRPLVIGDAERLRQADQICATQLPIISLPAKEIDKAAYQPGAVECLDLKLVSADLPWGRLSAQAGEAAYQYLTVAAQLALQGKVAAICTAPLNKEALHAAGHRFPGHTELLAHLTGTPEVSMMLTTPKLRVLHVTTHIGLIDAIARIEPGLVERTIARGHDALEKSGIAHPRIGVCGINPHAGENGLFGHGEEEEKIVPAIDACRRQGWDVEGPLPADTLFYRAQRGDFDLVIAMYHDQGHGPVKVLGLESGVNITIGLPVVRTSVDHGTAFDIAGTGKADERSMLEAIRQAVELAPRGAGA